MPRLAPFSVRSRQALLALIFALAALAIPATAHAAAVQAEHFNARGTYPWALATGWGASGNAFLDLRWQGGPSHTWTIDGTEPRVDNLIVQAVGTECKGWAQVGVYVDGIHRGTQTLTGYGWMRKDFGAITLAPGRHTVKVALMNDYYNTTCDRNVWFDYVNVPMVNSPRGYRIP